ncbi:tyrosine-type recombinase/integrase [Paraferrimonas sedimenticola]|uniref:Lambda phage integrase Int n=1 Tax=Paraferrimonas sedimenticola TaxID=375674 RepID=A0AA37RUC5_9GAMM|nr:integrase family protein [Paraferrimonas sedimenticola]GLP95331.1 lambda phage integrase Int [Paraferrimonas sedimenticola]
MLTDSYLKSIHLKPTKPFEKADKQGLSVRVSALGAITFQYRYRLKSKRGEIMEMQRLRIGSYPELSLAEARRKHRVLQQVRDEGFDPAKWQDNERKKNSDELTLNETFHRYYKAKVEGELQNPKLLVYQYDRHVKPILGERYVNSIRLWEWMDVFDGIAAKTPPTASATLSFMRNCLRWALKRQICDDNPLVHVRAGDDLGVVLNSCDRVLNRTELHWLLRACDSGDLERQHSDTLLFLLYTGCRGAELCRSFKSWFNMDTQVWRIPANSHKAGKKTKKDLIHPIIDEWKPFLQAMLDRYPGDRLITTRWGDPLGKVYFHTHRASQMAIAWIKEHGGEIAHFTAHDLRRTARTNFSDFTTTDIAEIMLGHSITGVRAVYDKSEYLKPQAEAYSKWWARLEELRQPDALNVVVPLRKAW